ncbi:hypothetical protein BV22DRAFT_1124101 [Leucogyrophana mollusca]|uniref:Uncharacterized protein n=1 Tax=Leucogyrophana mollusca TaxID=85980 RepID=A0ACB8ATC9_9AGAM|nr:hypothetical protein BV22DRAFT_1124101 [Leucogyrophana mollusca]
MYAPTCPDSLAQVRARARSVTSSILDLPAAPEPVVSHQDDSGPSESESLRRPSFDSILHVPAVLEPGQQRPNKKRLHSPERIRRRVDPPHEQETSTVQPAASAERSLPTTRSLNALIHDRTRSVTSSIPDLPTVQQGIHHAISRFCNALSNPQFSVSIVEAPNDWLRANSSQILQVPSIHGKERVEVDMIYPVNQLIA